MLSCTSSAHRDTQAYCSAQAWARHSASLWFPWGGSPFSSCCCSSGRTTKNFKIEKILSLSSQKASSPPSLLFFLTLYGPLHKTLMDLYCYITKAKGMASKIFSSPLPPFFKAINSILPSRKPKELVTLCLDNWEGTLEFQKGKEVSSNF